MDRPSLAVSGPQPFHKHRTARPRRVLTVREVDAAKPKDAAYKLADGNGLHLLITAQGSKLWRWRYTFGGKEKEMALGSYPLVSLAEARVGRDEGRRKLLDGIDPMAERKAAKLASKRLAEESFEAVARAWWSTWSVGRSERHAAQVLRRFEADVFPEIGARPAASIEPPEIVDMAKKIERRGAIDIAKRAMQTTGQVFRYAVAHGLARRNPAADIRPADLLGSRKKVNYARVDSKDLPGLLRKMEVYKGAPTTRLALKLMALTFVRTSELIGARWEDFDLDAAVWRIPGRVNDAQGRKVYGMKAGTTHIVPLARQATSALRLLHDLTGHGRLLFPGERDHEKPMSNNTILKALEIMGYKGRMTGHGFRGVASTVLHEKGFDHAHIELQLAHQERNEISAAYNYALYLPQRAAMVQWWADYLDACVEGNVVRASFGRQEPVTVCAR